MAGDFKRQAPVKSPEAASSRFEQLYGGRDGLLGKKAADFARQAGSQSLSNCTRFRLSIRRDTLACKKCRHRITIHSSVFLMNASIQFEVEILPARNGDCLLLRCASEGHPTNILIDGGTRPIYGEHLSNKLLQLRSQGEKLDLLVVTHIDTDHIGGILNLLEANGSAASPSVIEISDVWHNGYRHLGLNGRIPSADEKRRVLAQVTGADDAAKLKGNISYREGDTLAKLLVEGGYNWNKAWNGGPVIAGNRITIDSGIEITILSPTQQNLEALAYLWRKGLQTMGVSFEAVVCPEFEDAFEKLASLQEAACDTQISEISASVGFEPPAHSNFIQDNSQTNGSSIAFLLEFAGIRAVFLGDSWPSVIEQEWTKLSSDRRPAEVDLVKISHHGSVHNTSPGLLKLIRAQHYVVSTDGSKHGHPDVGTLLWIADECSDGASLVFNYPSDSALHINKPEAKSRFGHNVIVGDGQTSVWLKFDGGVVNG